MTAAPSIGPVRELLEKFGDSCASGPEIEATHGVQHGREGILQLVVIDLPRKRLDLCSCAKIMRCQERIDPDQFAPQLTRLKRLGTKRPARRCQEGRLGVSGQLSDRSQGFGHGRVKRRKLDLKPSAASIGRRSIKLSRSRSTAFNEAVLDFLRRCANPRHTERVGDAAQGMRSRPGLLPIVRIEARMDLSRMIGKAGRESAQTTKMVSNALLHLLQARAKLDHLGESRSVGTRPRDR